VKEASLTFEVAGTQRALRGERSGFRALAESQGLRCERLSPGDGLLGCLACGHPELYTQRDFPRALGLGVVGTAALLAPFTHYLSLLAAAGLDALLYGVSPAVVVCYVCQAQHRGFASEPRHPRFDLGIAERLRFGPRAVMGSAPRPGGTAGAPEPEH
jgi:hypothetical protein